MLCYTCSKLILQLDIKTRLLLVRGIYISAAVVLPLYRRPLDCDTDLRWSPDSPVIKNVSPGCEDYAIDSQNMLKTVPEINLSTHYIVGG